MDNIVEVVTLLRRQSELELQLINADGPAVDTEHALETVRRRLAAHPQALNAALQTARALRRSPDMVSAQDVQAWGCSS
jgi:uncharacterized protein (DUF2336 family)